MKETLQKSRHLKLSLSLVAVTSAQALGERMGSQRIDFGLT